MSDSRDKILVYGYIKSLNKGVWLIPGDIYCKVAGEICETELCDCYEYFKAQQLRQSTEDFLKG